MGARRLKTAVLGIGRIAGAHLAAARALADEIELVALCSRDRGRAAAAAQAAGVGKVFTDHRELLRDPEVEAVVVCLPQDLHHPVGRACLEAGKHVLMEKPLALSVAEAEDLAARARAAGVTLMAAQSRRFPDAVRELVRRLPGIGPVFRVHVQFLVAFRAPPTEWWRSAARAGGLVIMLQGSHSLDSVTWWLGGRLPRTVYAVASRRNPAWEGEDEADILLGYEEGRVASVHLSLSTEPPIHEAVLVGERGHLRLIERPTGKPFGFAYELLQDGERVFAEAEAQPYRNQLREFAAAIREGRAPLAAAEEVVPVMRLLEAARRSARSGRPETP